MTLLFLWIIAYCKTTFLDVVCMSQPTSPRFNNFILCQKRWDPIFFLISHFFPRRAVQRDIFVFQKASLAGARQKKKTLNILHWRLMSTYKPPLPEIGFTALKPPNTLKYFKKNANYLNLVQFRFLENIVFCVVFVLFAVSIPSFNPD